MTQNLAQSVHQRLLNQARTTQRPFNELLQYFVMERFLYRLSRSAQMERFILKGALMFSAWQGPFARPTRDIDFQGRTGNDVDNIVALIKSICVTVPDIQDGVEFLAETVSGGPIMEGADYEGVRVNVTARLGTARIPFHIDVGFGDPIAAGPVSVQLPTLLDFPAPVLRGYSRETVIAEKYHAMAHHGEINSRLKDFYDVWLLATKFEFEGKVLAQAIQATFRWRETALDPAVVALSAEFAGDAARQQSWTIFLKRAQIAGAPAAFGEVVEVLRVFLQPITQALIEGLGVEWRWSPGGPWQT